MTALAIGFGFVGAGIASTYVDKTKKFEAVAKMCFAFATIFFIFFALVSGHFVFNQWKRVLLLVSTSGMKDFVNSVAIKLGILWTLDFWIYYSSVVALSSFENNYKLAQKFPLTNCLKL